MIGIVLDVILARPDDLHRRADRLCHLGCFDGVIRSQASPKTAPDQCDVDGHLVLRDAHRGGNQRPYHLRVLRGCPHFADPVMHVGGAVHRLHGGVGFIRHRVDGVQHIALGVR